MPFRVVWKLAAETDGQDRMLNSLAKNGYPRRPVMRYHGGKWELAPWIISYFPDHRIYVEPFGGAASVLLQKKRSWAEVYNDLDGDIVNVFRVLRDSPDEILRAVELTPFSRAEYTEAFENTNDPLERARRTLLRSHLGFAGAATHGHMTGFRSYSKNSGSHPASQWRTFPESIGAIIDRLRGVVVEQRDAYEVIAQQDSPDTLFYVDPPYAPGTRDNGRDYRHEMTDSDHRRLYECLRTLEGMVVLSGYPDEGYDAMYAGWARVERLALAEGARERTEVLWLNASARDRLNAERSQATLTFA